MIYEKLSLGQVAAEVQNLAQLYQRVKQFFHISKK